MRLLVHPGYPKTATTWLQTHGLAQAGVWQLGKGSAGDGTEDRWDPRVRDLHYRVFSSIYGEGRAWERFRTETPALREYADVLAAELNAVTGGLPDSAARQGVDAGSVAVLSDETMLAYGGVEMNAALLAYLMQAVRWRLDDPDSFTVELVLTIREQASFLRSFFAYVYTLQRGRYADFDEFVADGLAHPRADVFGSLLYDDAVDFLGATLPEFVQIRVVPYELLAVDGAVRFVDAFLGGDPAAERLASSSCERVVNASEAGYPLRDLAPSGRWRWRQRARRGAELSPEQARRVRELYAESNGRLDAAFGLGLERLGYAVG